MTWIIEGALKYVSDVDGKHIQNANTFRIFVGKDGLYTWTQDNRFNEEFVGIGGELNKIVDGLNKDRKKLRVKN